MGSRLLQRLVGAFLFLVIGPFVVQDEPYLVLRWRGAERLRVRAGSRPDSPLRLPLRQLRGGCESMERSMDKVLEREQKKKKKDPGPSTNFTLESMLYGSDEEGTVMC